MRWRSRSRREQDLVRELRAHLELETEERREAGLTAQEAHDAARRAFGNQARVQEEVREMWGWPTLERLRQDLRYAVRTLRRSPGFTAIALLALALGLGANTAIFSAVNSVLLRPLPFHDPGRLMMLDEKWMPRFAHFEATPRDFLSWREQSRAFEQIAAFVRVAFNYTAAGGPERLVGARVSANLPALLGVAPVLGRSFTPQEDTPGNDHVVLLGYNLWQRRFAGKADVIGSTIRLSNVDFTVIGVMPPEFRFPEVAEIWKPMGFQPGEFDGGHFIWGIGRLKPGFTREQAQAEMDLIMPRLQQFQVWSVNVIPVLDYYVGDVKTALYVLLGAAGFVLLIGCVNVANLLLARGWARNKEISLRASLGASRGRLVQQLLTESLLLAVAGGALGLLCGYGGIALLRKFPLAKIPRLGEASVDYRVLVFASALSAATGILFGLLPALRVSRLNVVKSGSRITRSGLRGALVVSEVALALVLLTGAGLLLKSFWRLLEVRTGFRPENVLAANINLPSALYGKPDQQRQFVGRLLDSIRNLPEVRQAAVSPS